MATGANAVIDQGACHLSAVSTTPARRPLARHPNAVAAGGRAGAGRDFWLVREITGDWRTHDAKGLAVIRAGNRTCAVDVSAADVVQEYAA